MIRISYVLLIGLFLLSFDGNSQSYISKDSVLTNPLIYASAGVYFPRITSRLRVDGERGLGTEVTLEEGFQLLSDMSVFRIDAIGRISKKSQLAGSFTSLQRSSSFQLDEQVQIFDTIFDVNANLDFFFDTYYYALTWRYSFFQKTNWNAGLSAGLRFVQFHAGVSASLNERKFSESDRIGAPAILFGVHGSGYLTPRLLARYSLEYFQLNVQGIKLRVIETRASLEYFISPKFGLGVAYSTNEYVVEDVPIEDFEGKVEFEFGGFNLFATARF